MAITIKLSSTAASNLRVRPLDPDGYEFAIVLSAQANPDGSLHTTEQTKKVTQSTGRLYDSLFVHHWDRYETAEKNSLWYGKLSRSSSSGKFELSELHNALKDTGLESPILPFGGTDNFDIGHNTIIFVAKDPELNPALNTKTNVYLVYLDSWTQSHKPEIQRLEIEGYEGAKTSPVFTVKGTRAAFLAMRKNGYEADRNDVFVIENADQNRSKADKGTVAQKVATVGSNGEKVWDRSPQSIIFANDGNSLLASAEEDGYSKLFVLNVGFESSRAKPLKSLTDKGSVGDVRPLKDGRIFVSGSSLVDNSWYALVEPSPYPSTDDPLVELVHSNSASGRKFGLKASQISSIWTPSSNPKINQAVHSIIVKPSNFSANKRYPVAYLIHGGPQGSWLDSWSTRWNPAIFAEQGYIVIAPNPTGSTGYGQEFTDAINKNWGGDPYQDIVNVFEWVGKNIPEADNERAVGLGASYGGYMVNWIQGHDLGRKFKALVGHDGIFSMAGGMLATEELYFPFHDLGGTLWFDPGFKEKRDSSSPVVQGLKNFDRATFSDWRRWDPSEHLANWSTPQLVIHSSKDYRLTISEGLAAFNVLQARGVDSKFLTFPDENHWVLKPENSLVWHKVVLNWINKYVDLPPYSTEDPASEAFWGGVRCEREEVPEMPVLGKPET